jgi:hypothetical protein
MSYKEHIPRFFLYTGSILMFISIFLKWASITNTMTGETTTDYGYNRPGIIIILIISIIPIVLYEQRREFTLRYLLFPFIEYVIFGIFQPLYIAIYSVETEIGFYIALIGWLFQIVGIFTAIIIERVKKKHIRPRPTAPSR